MKAGNYLAVEPIRQLLQAGIATKLPMTVLLTGDEEVGSPSTRDLIEAKARRHRYVLLPEPGRAGDGVATGRYAIARFRPESAALQPGPEVWTAKPGLERSGGVRRVDHNDRQLGLDEPSRNPGGVDAGLKANPLTSSPDALMTAPVASGVLGTDRSNTTRR